MGCILSYFLCKYHVWSVEEDKLLFPIYEPPFNGCDLPFYYIKPKESAVILENELKENELKIECNVCMEKKLKCDICMEPNLKNFLLCGTCNHEICVICFSNNAIKRCPFCRQLFKPDGKKKSPAQIRREREAELSVRQRQQRERQDREQRQDRERQRQRQLEAVRIVTAPPPPPRRLNNSSFHGVSFNGSSLGMSIANRARTTPVSNSPFQSFSSSVGMSRVTFSS
jgi:Zn-finger nucleic acid-binding protein